MASIFFLALSVAAAFFFSCDLTIAGCAVSPNTDYDITENYDKWVGFSAKWGDVIKACKAYY